ncbi:hypothetical protein ACQKH5_03320 [Hyphomonas sp. NPDC076900]|uniref:hypothetical protein n=1 Tax=unclassified Hyphomonas TaxID=2630699 RepID=UPI003D030316
MIQGLLRLTAGAGLALMVVACDEQPPQGRPAAFDPMVANPATQKAVKADEAAGWSPPQQAAFLAGRLIAADRVFRAGERDAAKMQLGDLRQQMAALDSGALQSLGFEPARIEAIQGALDLDLPEEEITPLFAGAESNLAGVIEVSGVAPKETVTFLMRLSAEAYEAGVKYGEIIDLEAYQAAYGYALAARDLISPLDETVYGDLRLELDILVLMWPAVGPLPGRTPPPEVRMSEQFARVKVALAVLP